MFPIECVIRGYLSGSAWKEYSARGTLAGEPLPKHLLESQALEPPVFSPATKAETGHDENITVAQMRELLGAEVTEDLERQARAVYDRGRDVARERGIIIADTKILIDEVLTPDSSRFWPASEYQTGRPQPSYDKQPLRDFLEEQRRLGRWNGEAPAPTMPPELVEATSRRYRDAFRRLIGSDLPVTDLS